VAEALREVGSGGMPAARPADIVPDLLLDAVAALAAARTERDVAYACLPLLLERVGARAAAVVRRSGRHVVVLDSAGYPCGSMAAGADLPLDAGLPVTEAVRTGRTLVQGSGPSWVAVPFGGSRDRAGQRSPGALLLSLHGPAPDPEGVVRLERLAQVLGDALRRAAGADQAAAELAALSDRLRPAVAEGGHVETAERAVPAEGGAGGDVLACLPDAAGGTWLVAADVCGSGLRAALVANAVRAVLRACAGTATGPAELLAAVDAAVAPDLDADSFVTALSVQVAADGRTADLATAGHPPPLLVHRGQAGEIDVEPGPPLALTDRPLPQLTETAVYLPPGSVLFLYTDGLTERRSGDAVAMLDPRLLAADLDDDLERAADAVLAAAQAAGQPLDDVSLLLARPRG
jgi:hypothetical protein